MYLKTRHSDPRGRWRIWKSGRGNRSVILITTTFCRNKVLEIGVGGFPVGVATRQLGDTNDFLGFRHQNVWIFTDSKLIHHLRFKVQEISEANFLVLISSQNPTIYFPDFWSKGQNGLNQKNRDLYYIKCPLIINWCTLIRTKHSSEMHQSLVYNCACIFIHLAHFTG